MKKLVVYGGSFNPPHNGHTHCITQVNRALRPDLILLVPSFTAPHKPSDEYASAKDRVNMLHLIARDYHNIQVDERELRRKGVSYTVDTLGEIKREYHPEELVLLMGQDMFQTLEQWREYREILKLATLCVVPRQSKESGDLLEKRAFFAAMGAKVILLNTHLIDISSTQIRSNIKKDVPIDDLVAPEVLEYIEKNRLYK